MPGTRGRDRSGRGPSPLAGIALGIGAGALLVLGAKAYAERSPATPRPADDAAARFHDHGQWKGRYAVTGKTILINKPPAEVYAYWRDLSNLAKFMENVRGVRRDGDRLTWTLANALGHDVDIEARLTDEREGERLAWESVPDAPLGMRGAVALREAPAGRGTYVELELDYVPPAGAAGRALANLVRRAPEQQVRHGLKRLKMLLEAGEVATSARRREDV